MSLFKLIKCPTNSLNYKFRKVVAQVYNLINVINKIGGKNKMSATMTNRITIRLSKELKTKLIEAKTYGCNVSAIVRTAIAQYYEKLHLDNSANSQELPRA